MHEILTVQCGNDANYVATHFWNCQDITSDAGLGAVNHDVLFSQGQNSQRQQTYTPRTLIYDRGSNFGALRRFNKLFEEPELDSEVTPDCISSQIVPEHDFQRSLTEDEVPDASTLESSEPRYWSDYSEQFFRPESYLPVVSTYDDNTFTTYDEGAALYARRNAHSSIFDHDVRPFLEECDHIQGFNILTSLSDGWSGFSTEMVKDLADEMPKISRFLYIVNPPSTRAASWNVCQSLVATKDDVDLIVPFKATSKSWRGSAKPAKWLDAVTVPLRDSNRVTMTDISSFMLPGHRLAGVRHGDENLGQIKGIAEREVRVIFDVDRDFQSRLVGGCLRTTFYHAAPTVYATSFPNSARSAEEVHASLTDSSEASIGYLRRLHKEVAGIKGPAGYAERKEMLESLRDMEDAYEEEFDSN